MTSREYHRAEWQKLKGQPLKAKLEHLFTYYRYPIIAAVILIAMAISLAVSISSQKERGFQDYMIVDIHKNDNTDSFLEDFANVAGINTGTHLVSITPGGMVSEDGKDENSMVNAQTVAVKTAAGELDVLGCPTDRFLGYAYNEYFVDLRQVFSQEQLDLWGARLIYIDTALLAEETLTQLPDPTDPSKMTSPMAVGLQISADGPLADYCLLANDGLVLGILCNAPNPEAAAVFLQYCS